MLGRPERPARCLDLRFDSARSVRSRARRCIANIFPVNRGDPVQVASLAHVRAKRVNAYLKDGRLWIKKLYLLPSVRGMGLGKQLIATIRDHYGRQHPQALYVSDRNETAIAFYKSQGFTVESLEPVQMGPYHFEDYVMVRPGEIALPQSRPDVPTY